jgi:hypothetical protein
MKNVLPDEQREVKAQNVIKEFCITTGEKPSVGIFKVLDNRKFYFPVCKGPNIVVGPGDLLELSSETARELFVTNRVIPFDPAIPELGKYRVLRPLRVAIDGLWTDLKPHEFVELTFTEALPLLKKENIALESAVQEVKP